MLQLQLGRRAHNCQNMSRRTALKAGFLGILGLTSADLLRLQAQGKASRKKSVILIWLDGGPSHLESYDPKPFAPIEYRGPYGAIRTNVPGIMLSETLPYQSKHADKMVLIRSVHHDNGDHFAAAHWMLTGRFGSTSVNQKQMYPSVGSYVARVKGSNQQGLPAYVGLPSAESVYLFPGYQGAAYLGAAYNPFDVDREAKYLGATDQRPIGTPKWLKQFEGDQGNRFEDRATLLTAMDSACREFDRSGAMTSMDRFQQEAMDMVLGKQAKIAFDLDKEDPRTADRYGKSAWGRYTLMARRLVEAGVTFVTVDMPHWDDHANIKESHGMKLRPMDQAVGALLEDLDQRGILDDTLVVVMGEFSRTPRLNNGLAGQSSVPGRDHWGNAISVMMAGGGLKTGQIVGSTNSKGEHPVDRPLRPYDILATVYHVLGIDYRQSFLDHTGRPVPILGEGEPIREII